MQSFKMKFLGVSILQGRGRISDFPIHFLHGSYNSVCSANALPVINTVYKMLSYRRETALHGAL